MQVIEVAAVDRQQDIVTAALVVLCAGLDVQAGAGDQVRRAAGVGDKLREDDALAEAVEQARIGEGARADARKMVGLEAVMSAERSG